MADPTLFLHHPFPNSRLRRLTDVALAELGPGLRCLAVAGVDNLSAAAIASCARPELRFPLLSLPACSCPLHLFLDVWAHGRRLDLSRCTQADDAALVRIARGAPRLRQLAVAGLPQLTAAGVLEAARLCPELEVSVRTPLMAGPRRVMVPRRGRRVPEGACRGLSAPQQGVFDDPCRGEQCVVWIEAVEVA